MATTKEVVIYGTGKSKHLPAGSKHTVSNERALKYIEKGIATDKETEKKVVTKKATEKKKVTAPAKEKVASKGPGTITTANVKKDGDTKSNG